MLGTPLAPTAPPTRWDPVPHFTDGRQRLEGLNTRAGTQVPISLPCPSSLCDAMPHLVIIPKGEKVMLKIRNKEEIDFSRGEVSLSN